MATTPAPAPEAQAPINHISRIFGVLFSPRATFEEIARRPSWIAPIVVLAILGSGVSFFLNQRVDWGSYIRQKAEQNPRFAQLTEEQKQNALGVQVKLAPVLTYVFGAVGAAIAALFFALVFWGAFNLFAGSGLRFSNSFGIAAHSLVPSGIGSLLGIVIMAAKKSGEIDPEHLVASNVGALLGNDAPRWLAALGSSLDIFWIWIFSLLAIGFSAANPKKASLGKALGIVFGLWAVWVLAKVGWAAIFP
ncbi:MAG: YIP1 family protein [Acidobacteria bacterium]|nr:YIP1 family protein [Acidobacteriota bacterium]